MLEEKLERLTAEIIALRQAVEKGGLGTAAASSGTAAAPAKAAAAPKRGKAAKAAAPEHDKDEVAAIMRQAAKDVSKPKVQEYIGEQDCADLAELLTKPELFDAAFAFAEGLLGDEEEDEDI